MKERPILFSTPMVQAIMEGHKTMTRRVIKPQPEQYDVDMEDENGVKIGKKQMIRHSHPKHYIQTELKDAGKAFIGIPCPYGEIGDILWVRETFTIIGGEDIRGEEGELLDRIPEYVYKGEKQPHIEKIYKWKPSIFMPKEACRIRLEITNIRIERLKDISIKDALAEGVAHVIDKVTGYCGYNYLHGGYNLMTTPWHGFSSLWQSINGKESWEANPWVWVIEFKKTENKTPEVYKNEFS